MFSELTIDIIAPPNYIIHVFFKNTIVFEIFIDFIVSILIIILAFNSIYSIDCQKYRHLYVKQNELRNLLSRNEKIESFKTNGTVACACPPTSRLRAE